MLVNIWCLAFIDIFVTPDTQLILYQVKWYHIIPNIVFVPGVKVYNDYIVTPDTQWLLYQGRLITSDTHCFWYQVWRFFSYYLL